MMPPTPSQRAAMERQKSFRAAIAARAVPKPQEAAKPAGVKGSPVEQEPAPMPLPRFDPSIVWPALPTSHSNGQPRLHHIKKVVAKEYRITLKDMDSPRRLSGLVMPRHIAMYLGKTETALSFPQIGRLFGDRDHTTAINAVRKIQAMISSSPEFSAEIQRLRESIAIEIRED
jgi:hypothetical protein